jgi:hypothetical protein
VLSTLESFVRAAATFQEPCGSACSTCTCMGARLSQTSTEVGMLVFAVRQPHQGFQA